MNNDILDFNKEDIINCIDTLVIDKNTLVIKDSASNEVINKEAMITMIQDSADEMLPKAIIVEIEATHSGLTKNMTEYQSEYMKKSAKTWTTPYNKPVLLGHDQSGITLGRVKSHEFKKSELNPDKDTIKLTLEITDPGSIRRHLDGTALTYSIGASVKEAWCSICACNIVEDYCGHWKGNVYKVKREGDEKEVKEQAKWIIGLMEYVEVSEVNIPADVWAQVLTVKAKEEDSKKCEKCDKEDEEDSSIEPVIIDLATTIDQLASIVDSTTIVENTAVIESVIEPIIINEEAEKLSLRISELEEQIVLLNTSIEESTKLVSENEELKSNNIKLQDENTKNHMINIELAKTIKKMYTDAIVNGKIILGDISLDNKEEELNKTILLSTKELSEAYSELVNREQVKTNTSIPKITQEDIGSLKVNQDRVDIDDNKSSDNIKQRKVQRFTAANAVDSLLDN